MLQSLTDAEQAFVHAVSQGLIYETSDQIRAEIIRALMLGIALPGNTQRTPTPCGIRLNGATIEGLVNLNNGRGYPQAVMPGLALEHCLIPDGIDVSYAELGKLSIEYSQISFVRALRSVFHGEVIAKDIGPISDDPNGICYLDFRGAQVEGDLLLNRSSLREPPSERNPDKRKYAFSLRNAFVNGTVYFRQVDCRGTLNLSMAVIEGNFTARGSSIVPAPDMESLLAEDVKVKGGLLLRWVKRTGKRFTATGRINLKRATLGGAVFDRAKISDNRETVTDENDYVKSVDLEDAVIEGGLYFREGFELAGTLSLVNASIRTDIDARGASVANGIVATAAKIGCALRLDNVQTGPEDWIDLTDVTVGTVMSVRCLDSHLDLRRASTKTFDDGCDAVEQRKLRLDGFLYERLESVGKHNRGFFDTRRLNWLSRQEGYRFKNDPLSLMTYFLTSRSRLRTDTVVYRPQPFIQLGRVLEAHGYENDARKIWRMTEWMEWSNERRRFVKPVMSLFGACFGFGYSPARSIITILVFVCLGYAGYIGASASNLLVYDPDPVAIAVDAKNEPVLLTAPTGPREPIACKLDPLTYTLDLMIPFVELHKSEKCDIREDLRSVPLVLDVSRLETWQLKLVQKMPTLPDIVAGGRMEFTVDIACIGRVLHTVYALLGWLIMSLTILTFSGLLRQKERAPS